MGKCLSLAKVEVSDPLKNAAPGAKQGKLFFPNLRIVYLLIFSLFRLKMDLGL